MVCKNSWHKIYVFLSYIDEYIKNIFLYFQTEIGKTTIIMIALAVRNMIAKYQFSS